MDYPACRPLILLRRGVAPKIFRAASLAPSAPAGNLDREAVGGIDGQAISEASKSLRNGRGAAASGGTHLTGHA
jgi:hypothetical protein